MVSSQLLDPAQIICVLGFPRSGTSWFANLLNSHPETLYRHEVVGRLYKQFGIDLFRKLKFSHGLSDADRRRALEVIVRADVQSDKPPFFKKHFRAVPSPQLQKLAWLAGRGNILAAHLYTALYTPTDVRDVSLVLKETRSAVNLDSILKGIRADALIVLIRHPYSVVASHIRGIRLGAMKASTPDTRASWIQAHRAAEYVGARGIGPEYSKRISESEFIALCWRIQNEEYLKITKLHGLSQYVLFEKFIANIENYTAQILSFANLDMHEQVDRFIRESSGREKRSEIFSDAGSEYFSVYRKSKGESKKWEDVLTTDDIRAIDAHTEGFLEQMNANDGFVL